LLGIYTTLDILKYLFSKSIVLDNYRAIYLVNLVYFLELESFYLATRTNIVKAGTLTLKIIGYKTRRLKNALYRKQGKNTKDLILKNIAVINQFYINIVSKALL
jgi:hypothetical protein